MASSGDPAPLPSTGAPTPGRVRLVELDRRSILGLGAVILAMSAGYWLVRSTSRTTTWLVIALLLSLALDRVVAAVERRFQVSRTRAVGVVLAGAVAVVLTAAVVLVPPAIRQAQRFPDELPSVVSRLDELPLIGKQLARNDVPAKVQDWIENLPERLGSDTKPISDALRSVAGGLLAAFSVLALTVVLLLDGQRLVGAGRRLVPPQHRSRADRLGRLLYRIVGQYFAGSLLVATLAGTGVLVMGLLLKLPLAPLAGVWVMFTNLIPQIGGAAGAVPFVLLGLSQSPTTGAICAAYFLAYQQFENHVLGPTIVGEAVDLSPPATMMAALVGASAAGVPGALVAVPLAGVVKALYLEVRGRPMGHTIRGARSTRGDRLRRLVRRRPREGAS